MERPILRIWRLHPAGVRLEQAKPGLLGGVHPEAMKYCGPFTHANKFGWWVYPPLDMDVCYHTNSQWEHRVLSDYPDSEEPVLRKMRDKHGSKCIREADGKLYMGPHDLPKKKFSFGVVEPDVFQFWSGCIFQLPRGWALHIRNPINFGGNSPFLVQEAIVEVDWLRVDHWFNFKWISSRKGQWASIRRDQVEPIAQIVPVLRDSYDESWRVEERLLKEDDPEATEIYQKWDDFYFEKFVAQDMKKDPTTYWRKRKEAQSECPFAKLFRSKE
jgi:hypothetical protein